MRIVSGTDYDLMETEEGVAVLQLHPLCNGVTGCEVWAHLDNQTKPVARVSYSWPTNTWLLSTWNAQGDLYAVARGAAPTDILRPLFDGLRSAAEAEVRAEVVRR